MSSYLSNSTEVDREKYIVFGGDGVWGLGMGMDKQVGKDIVIDMELL